VCECVCMPGEGGESAEIPKIGDSGVVCVGVCFMCVCVCMPGESGKSATALQHLK